MKLICAAALVIVGCSDPDSQKSASADQPKQAEETADVTPVNTCSLLTSEELQAVQGEPLQETKPSEHPGRGVMMYDCLFTLPTFTNSVSLSVIQRAPGSGARDPRQEWKEIRAAAAAKASEKVAPPQEVEGIGDDAFWTGDDRMGALYVLQGNRFLRISVGGASERGAKLKKSQMLAEAALKRL